jgi:hypothetical protein
MARGSRLAEVRQDRIDELESLIDLLTDLGTREYDLTGDEDKQDDLGLHHTVDETREQLRLVGRESVVARCKTLQTDGELDVAGSDDVLNLEVLQSC